MPPPRSILRPILALLALLALASAALGGYGVSISGGTWESKGAGGASPAQGANPPGGEHGVGTGGGYLSPKGVWFFNATFGTCKQEGAMTAVLAWSGGARPPAIVVKETATAWWSGNTGACSSGLGGTPTPTAHGETVTGIRYKVIQNPQATETLPSVEPTANANYGTAFPNDPAYVSGGAYVKYTVEVYEVRLDLSGGLMPTTKELLVGQQMIASVSLGGAPTSPQDTYQWSLSDGTITGNGGNGAPFSSWGVSGSPPAPTFVPYSPSFSPTVTCCFRKPDYVEVKCSVTLAIGVSFTVEACTQVAEPEVSRGQFALGAEGVYYQGVSPVGLSDPWLKIHGAELYDPPTGKFGIWWRCQLKTPQRYVDAYGDTGTWCYVQNIDGWDGHLTFPGPAYYHTDINGHFGLDTDYPYPYPGGHHPAGNNLHRFEDAPGTSLDGTVLATLGNSFSVYRMYRPPGLSSSYVPNLRIKWFTQGSASFDASSGYYTLTSGSQGTSASDPYPIHPMWPEVLSPHWVPD